jgi:hypothetical protein
MIVAVAAHLSLLPIVPLLLLPFAIIFFVLVFPLWAAALAVLGLLLLILRGLERIAGPSISPAANGVNTAFRWVLTFGGFVRLGDKKEDVAQRRT